MKNLLKVLTLGLALFFIGCGDNSDKKTAANAPEASKEVVYKVGSSADYPPFEYLDDKNQIVGFEIDLLNEITKKTGIKFDVTNMSFDGLIPALKTGKIDIAISGMSATDERRKSVDFTKPYYFSENLFIRKKGSDVNKDNLNDKKISAQVGTIQEDAAKKITTQSIPAENVAAAIMSLNAGKIDVVLTDSPIGVEFLKQNPDLEEFLRLPDGTEGFAMAFDKGKYTDLVKKIDAAIEELQKSGEFDKMLAKYGLKK